MIKIGGVKSSEVNVVSRNVRETCADDIVSIEPQLSRFGKLTLLVSGRFCEKCDVRNKITDYGNEWMSIGLFPGYDSLVNGYQHENGVKEKPAEIITALIICNGLVCGLYTVCSLFEFLDPRSAKLYSGGIVSARVGLLGTYKYEGARYEIKTYEESQVLVTLDDSTRLLKNYCIVIDGARFCDIDGVVSLGKNFESGDTITFKILSVPQNPQMGKGLFVPFVNHEFKVICR